MRLWLKPDRMAALSMTATDIQQAVAAQNQQYAAGRLGASPTAAPVQQTIPVATSGRMTEPSQFDNIILRAQQGTGAIVRVKDIGRAELGAKDYSIRSKYNGKTATLIAIYQQPGANALQVATDVQGAAARPEADLSRRAGLRHRAGHDRVRAGVDQRGGAHLRRGGGAGRAGGLHLPAELSRHAGARSSRCRCPSSGPSSA